VSGRFIALIPEIDRKEVTAFRTFSLLLGEVPLEASLDRDRTLRAVVPPALPAGPRKLELLDPLGQRATAAEPFCVLGPPAQVAEIQIDAPAVSETGTPFVVTLTALDEAKQRIDRFNGYAQLSGPLSLRVGPFVGGVWTGTVAVAVEGTMELAAEVERSDDPAAACSTTGRGATTIAFSPSDGAVVGDADAAESIDADAGAVTDAVADLDGGGGDPDASADAGTTWSNETCATAIPLIRGDRVDATTCGATNDLDSNNCGVPGAPDLFYVLEVPAMGSATIRLQGAVLGLIETAGGCPTPEGGCIVDSTSLTNMTTTPIFRVFAIEAADGTCGTFRIDIGQ
jgi:hypothetical protein